MIMKSRKLLNKVRKRRAARSRAKVFGLSTRPRLAVFRSNRSIYAQLIDDKESHTLVHASSREPGKSGKKSNIEFVRLVGELLAKKASKLGIKTAVFDRRSYKYHGRVRALAEGAKTAGLKI